ncbi:MAG: terminase [Bacteroidales bacterium]|jgi:transcriptional regulator with XRE-family HTH domain|nr:terminase [Bacteroidales bacterium]
MATKKELDTKRELARMYYMQGETQKSVAEKTGMSEQTVSRWADREEWAQKRAGMNITRPELVNKSLMALNRILDQVQASDDLELVASLPDKLSKFAAAIEKLDRKGNIVHVIESFLSFSKWLEERKTFDRELKPEIILAVSKYQDLYINEHIKL